MPTPTVGRIVHYRLSAADLERRAEVAGNTHLVGDVVPFLIVRPWENEYAHDGQIGTFQGDDPDKVAWHQPWSGWGINGQAFLDGPDTLWITSAPEGDWPGSWSWPTLV